MILLLKGVSRLVGFVLLVALAAGGLAVAVFSIQGGTSGLSLPHLAELLQVGQFRHHTDGFLLQRLEGGSAFDAGALALGLGAAAVGILLLLGALVPVRERLVRIQGSGEDALMARRRPLARIARQLAEQAEGITQAKVRVRPKRSGGGTVRVRARHTPTVDDHAAQSAIEAALRPLTEPLSLQAKVRARPGEPGSRTQ